MFIVRRDSIIKICRYSHSQQRGKIFSINLNRKAERGACIILKNFYLSKSQSFLRLIFTQKLPCEWRIAYLYIELRFLVKGLAVVALAAEMIDAVVDVVVILVVVLRQRGRVPMLRAVRRVIRATVVLVLGQIGVRQQGRR